MAICYFFLIVCTPLLGLQLFLVVGLLRQWRVLFAERQHATLLAIVVTMLPLAAIALIWATVLGATGEHDLVRTLFYRPRWVVPTYFVAGISMVPIDVLIRFAFHRRPRSELAIIGMMLRSLTSMTTLIAAGLIEIPYVVD